MTEATHPITPPPELVQQWIDEVWAANDTPAAFHIAASVAQWGADQELEACCEWFTSKFGAEVKADIADLRAARRPKPPSLKEQALNDLTGAYNANQIDDAMFENIRCALEALPDD